MIGYHYTTLDNWRSIQKNGLRPYRLPTHATETLGKEIEVGIWVWRKLPKNKNHLGNLIRVVAKHDSTKVCLLKISYTKKDIFHLDGRPVQIVHAGNIERFWYHKDFPAFIISSPIPPEQIQLLGQYDLVKLVNLGG